MEQISSCNSHGRTRGTGKSRQNTRLTQARFGWPASVNLRLQKGNRLLDWGLKSLTVCNVGVVLSDPPRVTHGELIAPRRPRQWAATEAEVSR